MAMCHAVVHILSECTITRTVGNIWFYYAIQLSSGVERNYSCDNFLLWCSNFLWELRMTIIYDEHREEWEKTKNQADDNVCCLEGSKSVLLKKLRDAEC